MLLMPWVRERDLSAGRAVAEPEEESVRAVSQLEADAATPERPRWQFEDGHGRGAVARRHKPRRDALHAEVRTCLIWQLDGAFLIWQLVIFNEFDQYQVR